MALLLAFILPLATILTVERVASHLVHGPVRESLAPRHLFAKAGMVDAAVPEALLVEGPNAPLHRALERGAEPIRRLIGRAPGTTIAPYLTPDYEVFLQYQFALEERRSIAARRDLGVAMTDTALERLRHGWPGYLRLVLLHYGSLWLVYDAVHPASYQAVNAFIASERPLPYEAAVPMLAAPLASAGVKASVIEPLIATAGVVTFLLAFVGALGVLRPSAIPLLWQQAGLLALGLHGYCLLVALAGVGIPRYLLGVWPLLVCALGLALAAVLPRSPRLAVAQGRPGLA